MASICAINPARVVADGVVAATAVVAVVQAATTQATGPAS
jgi:hypothetical protein